MSDAGGNFTSEKFKQFCRRLNIECTVSTSNHHQSNGQVEEMQQTHKMYIQKCHNTNSVIHLALLKIQMMPLGPGLPSPATLLLNTPKRGVIPVINRILMSIDNDDEHHE